MKLQLIFIEFSQCLAPTCIKKGFFCLLKVTQKEQKDNETLKRLKEKDGQKVESLPRAWCRSHPG